ASTQPGTCCGKTRADRLPSADSSEPRSRWRKSGLTAHSGEHPRLVPRTTREFLNNGFPAPQGAQAEKNSSSTPHAGLLLQPNTRDLSDKTKQEVCRHDDDSSATPRRHTGERRKTHYGTVEEHQQLLRVPRPGDHHHRADRPGLTRAHAVAAADRPHSRAGPHVLESAHLSPRRDRKSVV